MKHLGIRERRESNRVGIRSKDDKERRGQESKGNDCLWISEEEKKSSLEPESEAKFWFITCKNLYFLAMFYW